MSEQHDLVDRNDLLAKSLHLIYNEYTGINEAPYRYIPCISVERIKNAPTIEPHIVQWISVKDRLPKTETEVLVLIKTNTGHKIITTAMYEDGKISSDNSAWSWYDLDFDYDEENNNYLIPEGWWEYRHYNPEEVYNFSVDDTVTHWMSLPEPPKEVN